MSFAQSPANLTIPSGQHRIVSSRLDIDCTLTLQPGGILDLRPGAELVFHVSKAEAAQFTGGPMFAPTDCGIDNQGTFRSHGTAYTRAWGKLLGDVVAGDTDITVDGDVSDWPVGGEIVLTHTAPADVAPQHETATIHAVNGSTLTLTQPLRFAHAGTGDMRGEVGLLTRDILIRTELEGYQPVTGRDDGRTFAHVMIHGSGTFDVSWTQFDQMGSVGLDGRYPIHFHRQGDASRGTVVEGVTITRSGNRCINRHESNGILVIDSIGFDSGSGTCMMNQIDLPTQMADLASAHNLVIGTTPGPGNGAPGEGEGRHTAAFWPGFSFHEAFLGDVAAGPPMDRTYAVGFHWPELPASSQGSIHRIMVGVEAHGWPLAGFYSWQVRGPDDTHDIVGFKAWHNGEFGVLHGAYRFDLRWYNGLVARQRIGIRRTTIHGHVQDTTFLGRGPTAPKLNQHRFDRAIEFDAYSVQPDPWLPSRYYRNTFAELQSSAQGEPGTAIWRSATSPGNRTNCQPPPSLFQETQPMARFCSSTFIRVADNTFGPGVKPYQFGWPLPEDAITRPFFPNTNSWWIDHDRKLVLLRKDVSVSDGPFPAALVKPSSFYDAVSDALATPCAAALPVTITNLRGYDGNPYANFPMDCAYNAPPKIAITSLSVHGDTLTVRAESPDPDITRVQFRIDWVPQPIVIDTQAPFEATIDLANLQAFGDLWPERNWHYLIVEAFDGQILDAGCGLGVFTGLDRRPPAPGCETGYEQRGYDWREIAPEMRRVVIPPGPTIAELHAQIAALQTDIAQRTADLATRTAELASVSQQRDSYQAQISILEQRIQQLSQALQAIAAIASGVQ